MAQQPDDTGVLLTAKQLIHSPDLQPLKTLISSVNRPPPKQRSKKKHNDKNVLDFLVTHYPLLLIPKLVLIMGSWHNDRDTQLHLNLLNSLLATLNEEQPSTTLDPAHVTRMKPVLLKVLKKQDFTLVFKDISVAVSIVASQAFKPGNGSREWIELLQHIRALFEDKSKHKMGLTLLRDLPLNIGKDWFMPYVGEFISAIFGHLVRGEEKESWVLTYGALVNITLQLAGTCRHNIAKRLSSLMVETVKLFLDDRRHRFVKKAFEELLVFLKRESWRFRIEHFYLLFRCLVKVTKIDNLVGQTKIAVVNVLDLVEKIGDSVKEKFQKHLSSLADVVSILTLEQKEKDEASGVTRHIDEMLERCCS